MTSHEIDMNRKIYNHYCKEQIKDELQDILAKMMLTDVSSLNMLKNNAKTLGGVIGTELQFFDDK
jgi:hypothetical protein|tara:strand:- start:2511 stop:2705 length:195 start_codon:yes stop_codon:yes gene_type:complete